MTTPSSDPFDSLFITHAQAVDRYGLAATKIDPKLPPKQDNKFWIIATPLGDLEPETLSDSKSGAIIRHDDTYPEKFNHTLGWESVPVALSFRFNPRAKKAKAWGRTKVRGERAALKLESPVNPGEGLGLESFAVALADQCKTHQAWLAVVRFGMGTLLQNQPLLIELIVRESYQEVMRNPVAGHVVADEARRIFGELGLRLALA